MQNILVLYSTNKLLFKLIFLLNLSGLLVKPHTSLNLRMEFLQPGIFILLDSDYLCSDNIVFCKL